MTRPAFARRSFLFGLPAAAAFAAIPAAAEPPILDRAMRRMGGRAALSRVRRLRWQGDAIVHAGGRDVAIGVDTEVVPFSWARSRTWLAAEGAARSRTLVITPDAGWVERDGRADPLPAPMVAHERAQYGIYGLMLLAALAERPSAVRWMPGDGAFYVLEADLPPAPPTRLFFDADARLAGARNNVVNPEGGADIAQHFVFSAEVMPGPVKWPRRLTIAHDGAPFFELDLRRFEAS